MKNFFKSEIIPIGLAIFSMLFGAGNLVYPLKAGLYAGNQNTLGMIAFLLTAVLLPLVGLVAMILFDGNYQQFFYRLGKSAGAVVICICMFIIGPFLAIPRIVTLSHTMIAPFLPFPFLQSVTILSSFIFALIFLGITFLATYRENKIVDLLGKVISPALVISLIIIIFEAIRTAQTSLENTDSAFTIFKTNFIRGYETLDLLGTIFFGSIVLTLLKKSWPQENQKRLALISLQSGLIGAFLLGFVYVGMSLLAVYHGHGLPATGALFRLLSLRVLGTYGAAVIGTAVLMACFSTSIALGAVLAEYVQKTLFRNRISFVTALILVLLACIPLSTFGLDTILAITGGPLTYVGYPVIIAITFCNLAYKLFGFKPIKLPVILTFIVALISYLK